MNIIRAVIDTNVLHAGLYSDRGASFKVLRLIERGKIIPLLSITLLFEYEDVLRRNQSLLKLSDKEINQVLDNLCSLGEHQKIYFLWRPFLPDPNDDHILELSVASGAEAIVTHNIKDFRESSMFGLKTITPQQLLEELR